MTDPDMDPDEVAAERRFSRSYKTPDPITSMAKELDDPALIDPVGADLHGEAMRAHRIGIDITPEKEEDR